MKTQNPKNLKKIIEKSKLNINELYYLIAYYYVKKRSWFNVIKTLALILGFFMKKFF
jgi:hypothetical protein